MISRNYIILAAQGMHARPATALIRLVKEFKAVISLENNGKTIRLNSLLGLLSLMIKGGDCVTLRIEGEDETMVAELMDHFFNTLLKDL